MPLVLRGERRKNFEPLWELTKRQNNLPDDPKAEVYDKHKKPIKQGDIMLLCLRAYERGREDEAEDWFEIQEDLRTIGRVRRASELVNESETTEER